jgi:hypothetical protein
MQTIIYIDGGAGRVIAAIPALLKYHRLNPDRQWAVIINAWSNLLWGIPELQDRVYDTDNKGIFDNLIKDAEEFIAPEPYRLPGYYRQELSLVEAFDVEINKTTDHSDLKPPQIIVGKAEKQFAANTIAAVKEEQKKNKTIVIQPFGRGARIDGGAVIDDASRSLSPDSFIALLKKLTQKYNLIFFGEPDFQIVSDTYTTKMVPETTLRQWASIVEASDYFIGVDSVGQHIARAVNVPGTVIFGSTFPKNTSYPDYFQIIEKTNQRKYSPIRIAGLDVVLADLYNDSCMTFSDEEINKIYNKIVTDIQTKTK